MFKLDSTKATWRHHDKQATNILNGVSGICPHCQEPSSFRCEYRTASQNANNGNYTQINDGHCVMCAGIVTLFAINPPKKGSNDPCESLWMFPIPKGLREFKFTVDNNFPSHLYESYEEAVNCHRYRRWRATVTECGRALEIISKDRFPTAEERKKLKKIGESSGQIISEDIPEVLFKPIISLNQAIRLGRNSGAHFNITKPADEEIATEVLDMLEYVIEYFYSLPNRVEKIKKELKDKEEA